MKPIIKGIVGSVALLGFYFGAITLISGWQFALEQFFAFWYFIVSLAVGFGIQIGLYSYLKSAIRQDALAGEAGRLRGALAFSSAASTAAMISCCAHYLVNILPVIAATGFVAFIAQYQVQFFWAGLAFNFAGILYIGHQVIKFKKHMEYAQ